MKRNVTMREIAESLGVSTVTVSKALAGKEGVSEALRERIQQVAQTMGYQPASAPLAEANENVGIIVADRFFGDSTFYASLYKKLIQRLSDFGCFGILEIVSEADEQACVLPAMIRTNKVQAIVVMGQISKRYIDELVKVDIPYLFLDFYNEEAGVEAIVSDGIYGAYLLTSHLIQQGHRAISFFGTVHATSSIMDRYLGYYRAMLEHKLDVLPEWIVPDRDEHGRFLDTLPLPEKLPTAFVCNCDEAAMVLLRHFNQTGIRVPEDISIVGFDDFLMASLSDPPLTTCRVDQDNMTKIAAEEIVSKLSGRSRKNGRIVVGSEIIYRQSVGRLA